MRRGFQVWFVQGVGSQTGWGCLDGKVMMEKGLL